MKKTILVLLCLGAVLGGCATEEEEAAKHVRYTSVTEKPQTEAVEPNFGPGEDYRSNHDPNAFYTMDSVTMEGSYLKVDFRDLTPEQFNRVIHRAKTEKSTCGSGLTIDECLVNRPHCTTALILIKQIVREEGLKS